MNGRAKLTGSLTDSARIIAENYSLRITQTMTQTTIMVPIIPPPIYI
jgi:hypothetical protein